MKSIVEMWNSLTRSAKLGLGVGIVLIIALATGLGVWAYSADYQVLFADVASRDAASMTSELDRMKVPYKLSDGGNTILVPKDLVYKTRLKLMEKDVPLHGAVGFEVFNNADFGMTEFVQKVNYLRAIQGELTRTILSIDDIQAARVHLAIPEQGLFKKALTKPKASVTLAMKPGKILVADQITGIQRLVAASVPDIVAGDVTILDQHGVALTKVASAEGGGESAGSQLDSKRSAEEYLTRKVAQVLDSTFGPGEAIASVDVVLNLDQSKVTTEEVLPAKLSGQDGSPTGVVVRERQSTREGSTPVMKSAANHGGQRNEMTSLESDYQVGRRVEQIVVATGAVKRLTIAVVVKRPMNESQIEKLKEVVSLAAGFNSQRGDAVVVYSMDKFGIAGEDVTKNEMTRDGLSLSSALTTRSPGADANEEKKSTYQGKSTERPQDYSKFIVVVLLFLLLLTTAGAIVYLRNRARERIIRRPLTAQEREQMLLNVREWIQGTGARDDMVESRK